MRGEVWDAGSYTLFHWVDKFLGIAAQLNFEYMYMGQEYNDDITLGEVIFYRLDEKRGCSRRSASKHHPRSIGGTCPVCEYSDWDV